MRSTLGTNCCCASDQQILTTVEDGVASIIGFVTGFDRQCRAQTVGTLARVALASGDGEVDLVTIAFVLAAERAGGWI